MTHLKTCRISNQEFVVSDEELAFYQRMGVPRPNISPDERRRKRLAWATLRTLHRRTCDGTGKPILSMYAPDAKHPVYHSDYWWSDAWDALDYGQEFDFARPFFEQFDELLCKVPVLHQSVINSENCEYINMAGDCKNCYLSFFLDFCEDCYYIQDGNSNRSCMDCLGISDCELCYECVDCTKSYELSFSQRCVNCSRSYFLTDCRSCKNCIGCCNLTSKEYYIFNEKSSREAFQDFEKSLTNRDVVEETRLRAISLSLEFPKKYYFGHSNEGFSGDHVYHIKDSYQCFNVHHLENVRYADYLFEVHNSMDHSLYGNKSEWIYNCLKTGDQCSNDICCLMCWTGASNNAYCHLVISCKDCFGCSGMRQKQYCILNKQYDRNEYESLKEKIVAHMKQTGEWGEFFPIEMSPFGYNESIAQAYYPLTKDEVLALGYRWREEENETGKSPQDDVPLAHDISDVNDDVLEQTLTCEASGKPYRIVKPELDFYRKRKLPPSKFCPEERHARRMARRNPRQLWKRACAECEAALETSYAPERPEKVLCESCYLAAID